MPLNLTFIFASNVGAISNVAMSDSVPVIFYICISISILYILFVGGGVDVEWARQMVGGSAGVGRINIPTHNSVSFICVLGCVGGGRAAR